MRPCSGAAAFLLIYVDLFEEIKFRISCEDNEVGNVALSKFCRKYNMERLGKELIL